MTESHAAPSQRQRLKAIIGGSTGNLVEWYDWYAYSAFTLYSLSRLGYYDEAASFIHFLCPSSARICLSA